MKLQGVIDSRLIGEIDNNTVLGVDIGSRGAKAVLLHGGELFVAQVPTGVNMQDTADELLDELLEDVVCQLLVDAWGRGLRVEAGEGQEKQETAESAGHSEILPEAIDNRASPRLIQAQELSEART